MPKVRVSKQQSRVLALIDDGLRYDHGVKTCDEGLGRWRTLASLIRRKLIRYGKGNFALTAAGDEARRESQ